ncbi:MAG TPA: peptidase M49 [Verrucomicrobiae bacterium]|nr:peptidase M49 [Verrucomicrobiae bacterium]
MRIRLAAAVLLAAALPAAHAQNPKQAPPKQTSLVARVADTGFVKVSADSFHSLTLKQQALAYWLAQASIAIDPIIYDQLSRYGLRQKRLLEEIVAHPEGVDPQTLARIREFTALFWANRGNHNDETSQKFLPTFTFDELRQAALAAQKNGALRTPHADLPAIATPEQLEKELGELRASLFDPNFEPMDTAKSPQGGLDIIQASSNSFYEGLSLADLTDFHDTHPLNSRVVKSKDGKLHEEIYRAGTPDGKIPGGLYAVYLKRANGYLRKAQALADPPQAQVIGDLIRYYETGDFNDWLKFGTDWVQNDATVDFANGFIEIYRDARGAKGSSQSFVSVTDKQLSDKMAALAANASYFEQKAPWDDKYKRTSFKPPVVKAVETLIETGDFHVNTIGDNLPNENEIHEKYGTKNFLFTSSTRAFNEATGDAATGEFSASPEQTARGVKYGEEAEDLETALHEVIGHGSGKLSDRLKNGAAPELKEYFSTLEEARADLMALWNTWDPKLKELGLVTDQEEVSKAMYDRAAAVALVQLRYTPKGETLEEDHARNRQLIVRYIMDKTGGIEQVQLNGKTYIRVKDYAKMREGVGMLLAELMRIKAEGDYNAIKALVDKYGVHFDPKLRDEVVARYMKLNLPTNWAGLNSLLTARFGKDGQIERVDLSYPRDPAGQYLRYGAMYDKGLIPAGPASH